MSQTITTADGVYTGTPVVVAATATPLFAATQTACEIQIINNSASVLDVGDATVVPGTGIWPVQGGGGCLTLLIQNKGAHPTCTGLYGAYPGGSGDCRVVVKTPP